MSEIIPRLFAMKVLPVLLRLEHVLGVILLTTAIIIALLLLIDEIAQRGKRKSGLQKLPSMPSAQPKQAPVIPKAPEPVPPVKIIPQTEAIIEKPTIVEEMPSPAEPAIGPEQAVAFSLKDEATKLFAHFKKSCEKKGLSFALELDDRTPAVIIGKKQWLLDLLHQLFSIALEQTTDGSISLKIKMVKANDKAATVQFLVTDTGEGLPPSLLKAVQEKDFSFQFNDALFQSILVKLREVKQSVEEAGGRLTVATKAGAGSTVGAMIEFGI